MTEYDALDVVAAESAALLAAARRGLAAPVPSCPGWDVRALLGHLGVVQRFHASHLTRGVSDPPSGERPTPPEDDEELLGWCEESTRLLLGTLREVPPDLPAWNFCPQAPKVAAFWPRRMALEASVHRWDGEMAHADARGFDLAVAVDGIDEVLTVIRPARLAFRPGTVEGVVRLELTDSEQAWTVELTADGIARTQKTPDAVLSGTASGVYLAMWGRVPVGSLALDGDAALVEGLRAG